MSEFIDAQDIAIRNRIAVDGRVNPTVEDWNNLLTHIDRLEQENAELRADLEFMVDMSRYDAISRGQYDRLAELRVKYNKPKYNKPINK